MSVSLLRDSLLINSFTLVCPFSCYWINSVYCDDELVQTAYIAELVLKGLATYIMVIESADYQDSHIRFFSSKLGH